MACIRSIEERDWTAREGESLVTALSEVAARVQRGNTTDEVLRIAGEGAAALGMRLLVLQRDGDAFVLRALYTAAPRLRAVEALLGQPVLGLRARLSACVPLADFIETRRTVYCEDLRVFDDFVLAATGRRLGTLEADPATSGVCSGVMAPLFVHGAPWGLLSLVSPSFGAGDAAAAQLFTSQVGSALEAVETIEALREKNRELVAVNAELSAAHAELIKRERLAAVGELAATVAHEVRNPLCVIFNSLSSLERSLGATAQEPTNSEHIRILKDEAHRLNHIVTQMLDLAKPRSLCLEPTTLTQLLERVVASAVTDPAVSGVRVRIEMARDDAPVAMDPRFMHQAVLNLVLNAMHASAVGGEVIVRGEVDRAAAAPMARVHVVDSGCGISDDELPRIFEPFFTTKATGTGLGLALVQRVAEAHAGNVACTSGGSGSAFVLSFPATLDDRSSAPPISAPPISALRTATG